MRRLLEARDAQNLLLFRERCEGLKYLDRDNRHREETQVNVG
jgi:hypothetical protein